MDLNLLPLYQMYQGQGIADLGGALEEIGSAALLQPLRAVINAQTLKGLSQLVLRDGKELISSDLLDETLEHLTQAGKSQTEAFELEQAQNRVRELLTALSNPEMVDSKLALSAMVTTRSAYDNLVDKVKNDPRRQYVDDLAFLSNLAGPGDQVKALELNPEIAQRKQ